MQTPDKPERGKTLCEQKQEDKPPCFTRYGLFDDDGSTSVDDDSISSCYEYSSDEDEEEIPHPIGFGSTRFMSPDKQVEVYRKGRQRDQEDNDEIILKSMSELDLGIWYDHDDNQNQLSSSLPLKVKGISREFISTKELIHYYFHASQQPSENIGIKNNLVQQVSNNLKESFENISLTSNKDDALLSSYHDETEKQLQKMKNDINVGCRNIEKEMEMERIRLKSQFRKSKDALKSLLQSDEAEYKKILDREEEEKRESNREKNEQIVEPPPPPPLASSSQPAPSEKEDKVPTQIPERNLPPRPTPPQQQETKPQSDYIVKAQKLV